jgi:glutathione S-transferase
MAGRNVLERGRSTVRSVATMIEAGYLADSEFLCGTPHPTIADIACYEELAQLCWAGLTDFEDFPRLDRWLDAMSQLPYHEPAHRYNAVLGDILEVPNTVDRFVEANVAGITALAELGVPVVGVD